jgi:quercetin dioxygenase-like cupin family protein
MFRVFDSRVDIQNLIIRPGIRARFLRMEPGQTNVVHSHDLGEEMFLVLDGQAEFEIEGHREILGPGQICFAARDELHSVRCVGDQPMTMYLSVTPHIEPTHTWWGDDRTKLSPRYGGSTRVERAAQAGGPPAIADLTEVHLAAVTAVAECLSHAVSAQQAGAKALLQAVGGDDAVATKLAIDQMWEALYPAFSAVRDMAGAWNELAAHASLEDG